MNTRSETLTPGTNLHPQDAGAKRNRSSATPQARLSGGNKKTAKNFEVTMAEITRHTSTHRRLFSKFIHLKAISALSDVLGSTLARPDALLSGGVFSFVLTLTVYVLAKNLGYTLSGFESIVTFAFGWTLGLVYDFLKLMVTGKH